VLRWKASSQTSQVDVLPLEEGRRVPFTFSHLRPKQGMLVELVLSRSPSPRLTGGPSPLVAVRGELIDGGPARRRSVARTSRMQRIVENMGPLAGWTAMLAFGLTILGGATVGLLPGRPGGADWGNLLVGALLGLWAMSSLPSVLDRVTRDTRPPNLESYLRGPRADPGQGPG
jgi:hypothetical protein